MRISRPREDEKIECAIEVESGPLNRTMPMPPSPGGVAIAAMVSSGLLRSTFYSVALRDGRVRTRPTASSAAAAPATAARCAIAFALLLIAAFWRIACWL